LVVILRTSPHKSSRNPDLSSARPAARYGRDGL
jgi:hypothetical protein